MERLSDILVLHTLLQQENTQLSSLIKRQVHLP